MVFRLGQTPFKSGKNHRVTAHHHDGVVSVTLGAGVSRCLRVSQGSKLRIAYNSRPGELSVRRASGHPAGVELYQNGTQLAFNINDQFIPGRLKDGPLPVRTYWRDTETMVLDFTPTATEEPHERSNQASR